MTVAGPNLIGPTFWPLTGFLSFRLERVRTHLANSHPVVNAIFGGWQLAGIYNFTSGQPLNFIAASASLGNGTNARANISGDPKLSNPTAEQWFNPQAFSTPALYTFGSSGIGILDAPGRPSAGYQSNQEFLRH